MPFPDFDLMTGGHTRTVVWGDVYWFHFGHLRSTQYTFAEPHPAVVVSFPDRVHGPLVTVVPLTGAEHVLPDYAMHVPVTQSVCPNLDKDSLAKCDHLYTVDSAYLIDEHYIGHLGLEALRPIFAQLINLLNLRAFPPNRARAGM